MQRVRLACEAREIRQPSADRKYLIRLRLACGSGPATLQMASSHMRPVLAGSSSGTPSLDGDMTRRSSFLISFGLGALTMLLAVVAFERFVPAVTRPAPQPEVAAQSSAGAATERLLPRRDERTAAAVPPPAAAATSRLLIPVRGVVAASLVDTYEDARGQGRRHDAIDIMAPRGTPVLAAADGVVMKLFQSDLGGTTLYQLASDGRTIYYYAHLDRYAARVAEGRMLRQGEVLGYVGNTGSAGPGNYHLHFEVSTTEDPARYWGGVPQNPYPLLR
jgi:peptidoglycan LD-endopeptidase LytH